MMPLTAPEFLPFKLDLLEQRVLWLRFTAAQRAQASFLDERALPQAADGGWLPLGSLFTADQTPAVTAGAIFHIGHCGSTLLSRVLDVWPGMQGLREPLPLRSLAEAWPLLACPESRLSPSLAARVLHALWGRWSLPLPPATRNIVKATSSCNGLIEPLMEHMPLLRTILLDMPLAPYLATLLKSQNSVIDAVSAAAERLRDLHARGFGEGVMLHALSVPEQCAMGWIAERLRFTALAGGDQGGRVLRVDFDTLLTQPEGTLQRVAAHFSLDAGHVADAVASPAWGQYSKAPAHGYDRNDRLHDLALAGERHRDGISEGRAWVDLFLDRHPQLREYIDN